MRPDRDADRSVSLKTLVGFLLVFGTGLVLTLGLPHAPAQPLELPDPASLEAMLRSSRPPLEGAIYVAGMLGWAIWAWLVLSLVLQVGVAAAERVGAGTTVVRRASTIADFLSLPLVRRAVRTSLAGGLMARVALGGVPEAAAAPVDPPPIIEIIGTQASAQPTHAPDFWASSYDAASDAPAGAIVYTVQPGDNLVGIAERFYADGDKWQLLYETNQGRQMANGRTFDRAGVIQPGWQLVVPEPTTAIDTDGDGQRWYTVRKGDSLAGISARLLGDESRWPDLYAANPGARLDELHVLDDPRLIWPGLHLRMPTDDASDTPTDEAASAATTVEPAPEVDDARSGSPEVSTDLGSPVLTAVPTTATPTPIQATTEPTAPPPVTPIAQPTPRPLTVVASDIAANESPSPTSRTVGGAAGAGLALVGLAGTTLVLRRRHRRAGLEQGEPDVSVRAGFAEAQLGELSPGTGGDDLATALTISSRLSKAVANELAGKREAKNYELPIAGARLAGVRHGRSSTTLLLEMPMGARAPVIGSLREAVTQAFGRKSDVEAVVSRDGDVLVRVTLVTELAEDCQPQDDNSGAVAWPTPTMLLRLGLLADRQVFAASWDALGHLLVAAPLSQSAEAVLSGLIASLVARRTPSELGFVVLGGPRCLPKELLGVPHRLEPVVDPQNEEAALQLLKRVRDELDARVASGATDAPDLVFVVPELAQLSSEQAAALGPVMLHGPLHGVRLLAASTRRAVDLVQECSLLAEFGTRLVLRTSDEEESSALLGSGDAADLGPGGHLLARLEGRVSLQAYGYRVDADRLARLAEAINGRGIGADWWERQENVSEEPSTPNDDKSATTGDQEADGSEADAHDATSQDEDDDDGASGRESTTGVPDDSQMEMHLPESEDVDAETGVVTEPGLAEEADNEVPARSEVTIQNSETALPTDVPPNTPATSQLWSLATAPRPRLRARFLGARELVYDGRVVWPLPGQPVERVMELLVFLGVQDPSGVRAELLADSLWSDEDDEEARSDRLRKRRYGLRLALKKFAPGLEGNVLAPIDKKNPVYRLNPSAIESDVHRFLKLLQEARSLPPVSACEAYEAALELYAGGLLERPDVPPYKWMDDGPRLVDLRVKYAEMEHQARRRLADLLASGSEDGLPRAQELYIGLADEDPLDHRLWEALARLHERRNDLLGLEATVRRLRSALVELGEGDDPERVMVPPTLARVFSDVRAALLRRQAA
jgi:DNA-binding SARP family transcriptional activator